MVDVDIFSIDKVVEAKAQLIYNLLKIWRGFNLIVFFSRIENKENRSLKLILSFICSTMLWNFKLNVVIILFFRKVNETTVLSFVETYLILKLSQSEGLLKNSCQL